MVAAVRELFGNPPAPPGRRGVAARAPGARALLWCAVILAVTIPLTLARYRQRTTD